MELEILILAYYCRDILFKSKVARRRSPLKLAYVRPNIVFEPKNKFWGPPKWKKSEFLRVISKISHPKKLQHNSLPF